MTIVNAKPFAEMTLAELHAEADDLFGRLRTWPSFDLGYAIMCGVAHRLREWIALREREQQQAGAS